MGVMTVPDVWSGQDRMLTVEDMENMPDDEFRYELDDGILIPTYWIVEPDRNRPELTVFELRSDAYEQTAHVTGDEEYRAAVPFAVTIVPSVLVRVG
jgi:hypothetical protein